MIKSHVLYQLSYRLGVLYESGRTIVGAPPPRKAAKSDQM